MDQEPKPGPESIPPVPPAGTPPPSTPPLPSESEVPPPQPPPSYSQEVPPPIPGEPFGPMPSQDERLWAMLIHLSSIIGAMSFSIGIPGGNLILPLIIWLIKREGSSFINDQGKEAVNFQITMTIAGTVLLLIVCVGWILLPVLGLYAFVLALIAAIKSNEGIRFRYPLVLRLIT